MFNQRERMALVCLLIVLCIGVATAWFEKRAPEELENFRVERAAVNVPQVEPEPTFIDLNSATTEDLERLPSIGEKMAVRIVEYRRVNGPFKTVRQLQEVRGVGSATLEKIAPFIRVK